MSEKIRFEIPVYVDVRCAGRMEKLKCNAFSRQFAAAVKGRNPEVENYKVIGYTNGLTTQFTMKVHTPLFISDVEENLKLKFGKDYAVDSSHGNTSTFLMIDRKLQK